MQRLPYRYSHNTHACTMHLCFKVCLGLLALILLALLLQHQTGMYPGSSLSVVVDVVVLAINLCCLPAIGQLITNGVFGILR